MPLISGQCESVHNIDGVNIRCVREENHSGQHMARIHGHMVYWD